MYGVFPIYNMTFAKFQQSSCFKYRPGFFKFRKKLTLKPRIKTFIKNHYSLSFYQVIYCKMIEIMLFSFK